jgi:carotenoid epsilon hydroxylase
VNESMRLYPHPPVLLRRSLVPDELPGASEHGHPAIRAHRRCHLSSVQAGDVRFAADAVVAERQRCISAGGYKLPKGQDVMISIYNLHHSPAGGL